MKTQIKLILSLLTVLCTQHMLAAASSSTKPELYRGIGFANSVLEKEFIDTSLEKGAFIAPNETTPHSWWQQESYQQLTPGAILGVGSERLWIQAAHMDDKCTALIMLDFDNYIIAYNKINLSLILLSDNKEEYKSLRFAKTQDEWLSSPKLARLPEHLKATLEDSHTFEFWLKIREEHKFLFERLEDEATHPLYFKEARYFNDDKMFATLKRLAESGKVLISNFVISISIKASDAIEELGSYLEANDTKVSLFDLSNTWPVEYTNSIKSFELLLACMPFDPGASILFQNWRWSQESSCSLYYSTIITDSIVGALTSAYEEIHDSGRTDEFTRGIFEVLIAKKLVFDGIDYLVDIDESLLSQEWQKHFFTNIITRQQLNKLISLSLDTTKFANIFYKKKFPLSTPEEEQIEQLWLVQQKEEAGIAERSEFFKTIYDSFCLYLFSIRVGQDIDHIYDGTEKAEVKKRFYDEYLTKDRKFQEILLLSH
jgi:hypothetical protein